MPSRPGCPVPGFLPSASAGVDLVEFDLVDLLAGQQLGFAGVVDLDLLQHLANDHLDVLVVDLHTLQPVDLLDLVDKIGGQLLHALDRQDVVRRRIAVEDVVALFDEVAFLHVDVLALRDQVLDRLTPRPAARSDAALVLVVRPNSTGPMISAMIACSLGRAPRTARPPAAGRR